MDSMILAPALYCVSTPLGNLEDITHRAVRILQQADVVYAKDTRVTRRLLAHLGIQKKLYSLHEHNESARVQPVLAALQAEQSVALVSDAGTPLISDPGYLLVSQVTQAGFNVVPVPGPCALIAALSVCGLPTQRFAFEGFLPAKASTRQRALKALQKEPRTLVFYEASHRMAGLLNDLVAVFGEKRELVIARELTKLYESIYRGNTLTLLAQLKQDSWMQKGEFVVVVAGYEQTNDDPFVEGISLDLLSLLDTLLTELSVKQATQLAVKLTGHPKNSLYKLAMERAALL